MPSGGEDVSSAEEDLSAAEADEAVSSAEEDLSTAEVEIMVSSAEEDLSAAEAGVFSTDTLDFLFLRGGSIVNPGTRGELSRLLRYCSAGSRLNICERMPSSMGERTGRRPAEGALLGVGSLGAVLLALALLPLALIGLFGLFPAGQRGRVQWNSGRSELSVNKVSAVKLR
jgi:hypothetical protein